MEKLTAFPELVDSFPKKVDIVRILFTFYWFLFTSYCFWLTLIAQPKPMKNTQGVPCGRGQTAPESLPGTFHRQRCGPFSI